MENFLALSALAGMGVFALSKLHYVYRWASLGGPIFSPQPRLNTLSDHPLLPRMGHRIAVLMAYTTNVAVYGDIAAEINRKYADRHGYRFVLYRTNDRPKESSDGRHITWDKLMWIKRVFMENKDVDYVFWIDCDAYFSDQTKKLEGILPGRGDISLCCNTRLSKNTNTGAMLFRRCPWTFDFIDELWKLGGPKERWHKEKYHEQSALDEMMMWDVHGCSSEGHVALFKPDAFNSDAIDKASDSLRVLNQFIVHRMGTPADYRKLEFTRVLSGIKYI